MDFYLTSKSLRNTKESGIDNDFEIIVFDNIIHCSKFAASFLSPIISQHIRSDITIDKCSLNFSSSSIFYSSHQELQNMIKRSNFVNRISNFLEGQPIHIETSTNDKQNTAKLLIEFGKALGNYDFVEKGREILEINEKNDKFTTETVKNIIELNRQLNDYESCENTCNYIASQFYSLSEDLKSFKMTKNELETVLSSPELKLESEDSLFDFICSLGPDYYFLFDYLEVQYLSVQKVRELIEKIDNYFVSFHKKLWHSICDRLVLEPAESKEKENPRLARPKASTIVCEGGIIEHLRQKSKQNPYDSHEIDAETTKVENGNIRYLFEKSQDNDVQLCYQVGAFIMIDFKDKKINFSKYYLSVPSQQTFHSSGRLKSWIIEGSEDKEKWEKIDEKTNDSSLNGYGKSGTYSCSENNSNFYRFIRIKEIVGHDNGHWLVLSEIEFYGSIKFQQ